ncbi:unnamed protein product [Linum trigynum]|uniref:Uncharacterized protein n=1 Tax=Linum trigynum TaxID=586398 RepID=A0AAV2DE85_9ROSI
METCFEPGKLLYKRKYLGARGKARKIVFQASQLPMPKLRFCQVLAKYGKLFEELTLKGYSKELEGESKQKGIATSHYKFHTTTTRDWVIKIIP